MIFERDREKLIFSFAKHFKKDVSEVREMVKKNPQILEDYNDDLVDRYEHQEDDGRHFKTYGDRYYE